jgi:hypothetical protein
LLTLQGASPKLATTVDDHDVRRRYASGTELLADFVSKERALPGGGDSAPAYARGKM